MENCARSDVYSWNMSVICIWSTRSLSEEWNSVSVPRVEQNQAALLLNWGLNCLEMLHLSLKVSPLYLQLSLFMGQCFPGCAAWCKHSVYRQNISTCAAQIHPGVTSVQASVLPAQNLPSASHGGVTNTWELLNLGQYDFFYFKLTHFFTYFNICSSAPPLA